MILAFILAFLTLSGRVTVNEVIVLATLMGIVNAVDIPTRQSFLVEMVGREDLMNAIALNSSMFNGARVIGPAIAGILVASIGEGWCFFANAVSYIAVIAGLLLMRVAPRKAERHASPIEHLIEGFRYVRHTAPIRAVLTLLGTVGLVALPYSVLMPVFAAGILHGNAHTLGLLMGATGVGALDGRVGPGVANSGARTGPHHRHRLRLIRCLPGALFAVALGLSLHSAASARGIFDDDAIGFVEHAHPGHGPRPAPRPHDGHLLDDVHGHGADWIAVCGRPGRPDRRAVDPDFWRCCAPSSAQSCFGATYQKFASKPGSCSSRKASPVTNPRRK